jgi:NADP-dependent 3-hydroxy acid dehydrogenase YdfG
MTTVAIVGAGPGLGAATARRFAAEGFAVALVSRSREHVDALAAALADDGVRARGYVADVLDAAALRSALAAAAEAQGVVEVLQYSPLPHRDFLKPLAQTSQADLAAAYGFAVLGPHAAVGAVLPGMRSLGRGTIVFVNGGSAVRPNPGVAGTSVAFAGEAALAQLLHHDLAADGIHVAQLIVPGAIVAGHPRKDPAVLARRVWEMHTARAGFRHVADDLDA